MKTVLLRELCQIKHGGTPSKANRSFWQGSIPWVSPKDMKSAALEDATDHISKEAVDSSATSIVPEQSILVVVRSGILAHSLPVAQVKRPLAFNQDIKALIPDSSKIDPDFLFWFIRGQEKGLLSHGVKKGATVHSLQSGVLENLLVPLPSRDAQRQIVDVLSRAEGIGRLRWEAQRKAAKITAAAFLDMFGDPATNPMGWSMRTIGELTSYTRYGPRFPDRQYASTGAHILRTTDIGYSGELDWSAAPVLPVSDEELRKYALKPGTLLITRTGATIGKTAIFRGATPPCIAGAYLIEIGFDSQVLPEYVLQLLLGGYGQARLAQGSRAVAQPNINVPTICAILIPLPPLEKQARFAAIAEQLRATERLQKTATAKADEAFQALLASCFAKTQGRHGWAPLTIEISGELLCGP